MRPHRLRCTAFGPFAQTVEIDLDLLGASGLFLLHGETGAGKTMLLDALGFALFGTVPGERAKSGRLRSDHASPDVPTEVQLEATLSGRRIRLTRSPQQERVKLRGTGTVTEPAKVLLEEQTGPGWKTVSTRVGEADAEVKDLIGMSADQFFQVVLLPQGEFARFLRAGSKDRGELLEKLFGTARFRWVEDWLVGQRIATSREVEAGRTQVALAAARVAQAAGTAEPVDIEAGWADRLMGEARCHLAQSQTAAAQRVLARDAARLLADQAVALAAAQARRAALLAAAAELAAQAPERAALRAECAAASRAAQVGAVLDQVSRRRREVEAAVQQREVAREQLPAVGLDRLLTAPELRAVAEQARTRSGRLEALRALASALAADEGAAAAARADSDRGVGRAGAVGEQLEALPARRRELAGRVETARAASVRLPAALAERTDLRAAVVDARALVRLEAGTGRLREELLLARESTVALRDKAADVREGRLDDVRFELASMLVAGEPCAVCGSRSHPEPSQVRGERVTREDEDAARLAYEQAQRQVADLSGRLAAAQVEREGLVARLLSRSGADLQQALDAVIAQVGVLEPLVAALPADEAALAALDAEQSTLEQQRSGLGVVVREASRRAEEAAGRAARAREQLTRELQGAVDLETALATVTAGYATAERVVAAEFELVRAEQEQAAAVLDAQAAAAGAGFADAAAAAAAARSAPWRTDHEQAVRLHDDELAGNAAALSSAELQVEGEPAAEVAGPRAALVAADAALDGATARTAMARSRTAALEELVPRLTASLAELGPAHARAREVRALADLCTGGGANQLKMTLSSFVLAARLEEVAVAASGRLLRMTQGRYSLVHTDGAVRGGARSGLGLLARDSWTGQDRETSTLSGGETFLASLALALGLTDVVMAESGGARIDALFVDEGFGTLDEDTLDEVMDVLDGLREGGRVVGIVSHLAELRGRIPAQVHVRKTRTGSDVVLVGC